MWFTSKAFPLDVATFIRGAASLKLTDEVSVAQYLKTLKPETEYVLSFYLKLENVKPVHPKRGFYVRFDEGSGYAQYLPTVAKEWSSDSKRIRIPEAKQLLTSGSHSRKAAVPRGSIM